MNKLYARKNTYKKQLFARFKQMKKEIIFQKGISEMNRLLSKKAKIILLSSCVYKNALYDREWYLMGMMELVSRQSRNVSFLEVGTLE